jgi:hypothetical protein
MNCTLCSQLLLDRNQATFDCGHHFHLSCVLLQPYSSLCSTCEVATDKLPDLGLDRQVAMTACRAVKIQQRQLHSVEAATLLQRLSRALTPLTPQALCFTDHMYHNKRLSFITSAGFEPRDAVQERVQWADIADRYDSAAILDFGFKWHHMVSLGIQPKQLQHFNWSQQIRSLELTAAQLLQTNMTVTELAQLQYTAHQLLELGFQWQLLANMGTNVETWPLFGFTLEDIKRYWSPTLTQWVSAGFYDKERVQHAGWQMEDVLKTLPRMRERSAGRVLRLDFELEF